MTDGYGNIFIVDWYDDGCKVGVHGAIPSRGCFAVKSIARQIDLGSWGQLRPQFVLDSVQARHRRIERCRYPHRGIFFGVSNTNSEAEGQKDRRPKSGHGRG